MVKGEERGMSGVIRGRGCISAGRRNEREKAREVEGGKDRKAAKRGRRKKQMWFEEKRSKRIPNTMG